MKKTLTCKTMLLFTLLFLLAVALAPTGGIVRADSYDGLDNIANITGARIEMWTPNGYVSPANNILTDSGMRMTYNLYFSDEQIDDILAKMVGGSYTVDIPSVKGLQYLAGDDITVGGEQFATVDVNLAGYATLTFAGDFWDNAAPPAPPAAPVRTPAPAPDPEPEPEPESTPESTPEPEPESTPEPEPTPEPDTDYLDGMPGVSISVELICGLDRAVKNDDIITVGGVNYTVDLTPQFGAMDATNLADVVTGLTLTVHKDANKNGNYTDPINGTSFLEDGDKLRFRYDFSLDKSNIETILQQMVLNPNYSVPIPWLDGFTQGGILIIPIKSPDGEVYAIVDITGGTAMLHFTGPFWQGTAQEIAAGSKAITGGMYNAYFELDCVLDIELLGSGAKTITLGSIEVSVNKPDAANELKKIATGYNNATRTIIWQVIYTPGTNPLTLPVTFTDTLDNIALHTYVSDSLKLEINGIAVTPGSFTHYPENTITAIVGNTDVSALAPADLKKPWLFTYETKATDAAFADLADTTVGNTATLTGSGLNDTALTDYADYTIEKTAPLKKENSIDTANHTITWKVTVNLSDYDLSKINTLTLHEYLPAGLTYQANSLKINSAAAADTNITDSTSTCTSKAGTSPNQVSCQFHINIPASAVNTTTKTCTVSFTTTVDDSYYIAQNSGNTDIPGAPFTNYVSLTISYTGSGNINIPETENTATISPAIVQKSTSSTTYKSSYNPETHIITWYVTVNPHKMDIRSGTITDDLNTITTTISGVKTAVPQEYVNSSFKVVSGANPSLIYLDSVVDNRLTIKVGNIGKNTYVFTFQTRLTNPDYYTKNIPDRTLTNTVKFSGTVNVNGNELNVNDTANGTAIITSNVLKKEGGGAGALYDYNKRTATWVITVNANKLPMTSVVVADPISEHQTFTRIVRVTAEDISGAITPLAPSSYNYNFENGKLTFTSKNSSAADSSNIFYNCETQYT